MTTLAQRLQGLRETAGISQRELGRLARLKSKRHVGLIESGERPNLEQKTIQALAEVLGSSIGYLSAGEGLPPSVEQVKFSIASAKERAKQEAEEAEEEEEEEPPASARTGATDPDAGAAE